MDDKLLGHFSPPALAWSDASVAYDLVVDAAQIHRFTTQVASMERDVAWHALPGDTLSLEAADASPHMARIRDAAQLSRVLKALAAQTSSHGAFTILESQQPLDEVQRRLRLRLDAELPDKYACMNRFFDGRVLPHLYKALSADARQEFFSVGVQWWYLTPEFEWATLACENKDVEGFVPPLRIDAQQLAVLVDACYPYAILDHFGRTDPELLDRVLLKARYAFMARQLRAAAEYGIEGGSEAVLFCTLALTRGEGFHDLPEWKQPLAAVKEKRMTLQAALRQAHSAQQ